MAKDARIDDYIARAAPFAQPILTHLRALIHAAVPGLDETIKWGMPHFTLGGRNLAGLAAFKAHTALVLHGEGRVSAADSEGMGGYGKLRSLADLPPEAELVAALQAAAVWLASGEKKPKKPAAAKPEIAFPNDFGVALSVEARAFFDGLAPSQRYEYLEWITGAKRDETRARRIAQAAVWLGEGKRFNWKYEPATRSG
ncbi:YdeI/OmpD-associated family protein [Novosphingobium sp. JCM 18896]|uniref:YdeI/OmpD-associated family protein n=1 Tax=Novosphingobium sp. JCM 18896 TaxID=2989731 RepID=UPI002221DA4D|nr:YdeI/OmpD-associated family protein [Novosphingobium sp. JCM 18896]MCW1431128.1 YdeI/OmpD-associated family protein [Novosphingobium sp. JCM 18896]